MVCVSVVMLTHITIFTERNCQLHDPLLFVCSYNYFIKKCNVIVSIIFRYSTLSPTKQPPSNENIKAVLGRMSTKLGWFHNRLHRMTNSSDCIAP